MKDSPTGFGEWLKTNGVLMLAKIFLIGNTVTFAGIWFIAFLAGGQATVSINYYNEAYFELFLWAISVPCILVWLIAEYNNLKMGIYIFRKAYRKKHKIRDVDQL
jgi:hypothetical protein